METDSSARINLESKLTCYSSASHSGSTRPSGMPQGISMHSQYVCGQLREFRPHSFTKADVRRDPVPTKLIDCTR